LRLIGSSNLPDQMAVDIWVTHFSTVIWEILH
jgi:hypothetical protein